jgi:hypothetical protein
VLLLITKYRIKTGVHGWMNRYRNFIQPQNNESLVGVYTFNPRFSGGRDRRILSSRPAQEKLARDCLKNQIQRQKKVWKHSSRGTKFAYHVQDTGFNPQYFK